MLLNDQENTDEIKEELKKYIEKMTMKTNKQTKPMGCSINSSQMEVYNKILPQETR